ncbi:MAG: hypothetical protein RLZZ628_3243 [Bacteroidota bacterium]|jgi:glycine amidinotransferase
MVTKINNPVCSFNEWDRLEETIVGRLENAMFPSWDYILKNTIPTEALPFYEDLFSMKGKPVPDAIIDKANEDLEQFIAILKREGVTVHQPDVFEFSKKFSSPFWNVESGVSTANPRDVFFVVGNLIIECPMADRGRYFEMFPYRNILNSLFLRGAKWISAPKPMLKDSLYNNYSRLANGFSINEEEITFDAADFVRCDNHIIGQLSHVTNSKGVKWLESVLGEEYKIHLIDTACPEALHIDTTIMPLNENTLLVNAAFLNPQKIPTFFKDWNIIIAPKPHSFTTTVGNYKIVSDWMSMNMLSLDSKTVIVEEKQKAMIQTLKKAGFSVIPCPFENYYLFGGSFHCATLDLRRKCNLKSKSK